MKILLTSVGRRGYLVKFFKEALGDNGEVWGGDTIEFLPVVTPVNNTTWDISLCRIDDDSIFIYITSFFIN